MDPVTIYLIAFLKILGAISLLFLVGILFNLYRISRDFVFVSNRIKLLFDIKGWLEVLKIIGGKKKSKKN